MVNRTGAAPPPNSCRGTFREGRVDGRSPALAAYNTSVVNSVRVVLTYKDYEALPDDGRRYEIHEGELSVTPAPTPDHQRRSGRLFTVLSAHVNGRGLGEVFFAPVDVILTDTSIVQPDLVFVAADRAGAVSSRGIEGPPTLVIEILSPSTARTDRHTKLQLYARHGVPYYWIVDPDSRTIEAYALAGDRYAVVARAAGDGTLAAPPFEELTIALATIWD
jgi:Uma2 family endonuclease